MTQDKSTHRVEVVRVHPKPHPNADKLAIAEVYGYSVCVGINDFRDGDLGIYLPPDSVVPENHRFKFVWEMKGYAPPPPPAFSGQLPASAEAEVINEMYAIPARYRRIKAKVLRGVVSEGLLLPISLFIDQLRAYAEGTEAEGCFPNVGDDVASILGITHYEPDDSTQLRGDCESAPRKAPKRKKAYPRSIRGWIKFLWNKLFPKVSVYGMEETDTNLPIPDYDVDAWQRHGGLLEEGEMIWVTEKIHGSNFRAVYMQERMNEPDSTLNGKMNGRMYVGSHYQWKKDMPGSAFWLALRQNPWIESFCKKYPGFVLYGELVPTQKKLKYGCTKDKYRVFAFDVLDTNQTPHKWLNMVELDSLDWIGEIEEVGEEINEIKILNTAYWVPTIYLGSYNKDTIRDLANGQSTVPDAGHLREGIVIKPFEERHDPRFGRVIMKIVSPEYLASKQSDE